MKHSVAIITRTIAGREMFLKRAIHSVLNQTFSDFVHIIVVDGPSKKDAEKIVGLFKRQYAGRSRVIISPSPHGKMEAASNYAIKSSSSEFVTIHDDDDTWEPTFLQKTIKYLTNPSNNLCMGVVTRATKITELLENRRIVEGSRQLFNPWLNEISLFRLLGENTFPPISFIYRREVYENIGYYDESLLVCGDWDFNIRFVQKYDIGFIPEPLANYHFRYTSDPIIGNTVTTGISKHFLYSAMIRNRALRDDLSKGVLGIGYLMNSSYVEVQQWSIFNEMQNEVRLLSTKVDSLEYLAASFRRSFLYRIGKSIKSLIRSIKPKLKRF